MNLCDCEQRPHPASESNGRKHMNGCGVCIQPKNWTNNAQLQAKWENAGRVLWFENGNGYLELCAHHWCEVRRWINEEPAPAVIAEALAFLAGHAPRSPPVVTLEAFG